MTGNLAMSFLSVTTQPYQQLIPTGWFDASGWVEKQGLGRAGQAAIQY
jgi:hypothetical protein